MSGIGNITRIEQDYMNAMIALSRACRKDRELVKLIFRFKEDNCSVKRVIYVPKSKITSIEEQERDNISYYMITTSDGLSVFIDKQQGDELIKNW